MSLVWQGGILGLVAAAGLLLVIGRVRAIRRPPLALRVTPYLVDLPQVRGMAHSAVPSSAFSALVGPWLRWSAEVVDQLVGGTSSIRRKLDRAGSTMTVHDFRVEQVVWGLVGFGLAAAWGLWRALQDPSHVLLGGVVCALGFGLGVLLRENRLTAQVRARERSMVAEFPTIAELLALAVAAGESPAAALERVVARSAGELSADLSRVLAQIRTGMPVAEAFDGLAARTGLPIVGRFASAVAVATERGTPLAEVLHAQAADVRESGRRDLIEAAARKEVLMMVPVVFLVLPVTVMFAFYPGVIGLNLS